MMKTPIIISLLIMNLNLFSQETPLLKIGLVADPQYENADSKGTRFYRGSLSKLKEAVDTFNSRDVDFVQNLGDIINGKSESFDSILPIYNNLNPGIKNYHLLGNHDFAIKPEAQKDLLAILSMDDYYYSYEYSNWRFIVLDATDISYFSNTVHEYGTEEIDAYFNKTLGHPNHFTWNSAIGIKQQEWLKNEIIKADAGQQNVIIFSHMPVKPLNTAENLWNDLEIAEIIEKSSSVKAFICGHRHAGNYIFEKGIHYLTLRGMVETTNNSFYILDIFSDRLDLTGFGNEGSKIMLLE